MLPMFLTSGDTNRPRSCRRLQLAFVSTKKKNVIFRVRGTVRVEWRHFVASCVGDGFSSLVVVHKCFHFFFFFFSVPAASVVPAAPLARVWRSRVERVRTNEQTNAVSCGRDLLDVRQPFRVVTHFYRPFFYVSGFFGGRFFSRRTAVSSSFCVVW